MKKSGMNIIKNNNLNPLFIGFGKQALEYAKVFKHLNVGIAAAYIRNFENYRYRKFFKKNIGSTIKIFWHQ